MDFTLSSYKHLINILIKNYWEFQTFHEYLIKPKKRCIILRHDVDLLPQNSLTFARIQNKHGIKGSYYFRAVPESMDELVIKEIADLGHEIGYHYENLTTCNGNIEYAIEDFKFNLQKLLEIAPISSICMHGSPSSRYDSKDIWKKHNYHDYGIIGEPYFDIDFNKVFYLTDTGRRWDGWQFSVRDKIPQQNDWIKKGLVFHSTNDIIKAVKDNLLPNQVMFTFHPQRWTEKFFPWLREYILQSIKNPIKKIMIKSKG